MHDETLVNHQPQIRLEGNNRPLVCPLYHSVKYTVESLKELEDLLSKQDGRYYYSRASNPTVRALELLLAKLQGTEEAIAVGSGVAALSVTFLSLLKPGDHVIYFMESYKPTRYLIGKLMAKFGVASSMCSLTDLDSVREAVRPGVTKMVVFESPTNPMVRLADIKTLTQIARDAGAWSVLDNTFAGLHNHGQFAVDLFIHSLTKFAVGHGDAMGGAILGSADLLRGLREDARDLGPVLDPHAAYLILRGMKTYFLRYRKQCENAMIVARFLEDRPEISSVSYPGLPSHPDHALAKTQMKDFGTVLSIQFPGGKPVMERFINHLTLFSITASLGATESLAVPAQMFYACDFTEAERKFVGIDEGTVRLAIGIEDPQDLLEDLKQSLEGLGQ